ncbi:hypothetical protein [Amycolatopsis azurea]|uniref:Uncharacterized protein n=1 Tax=Amycolatopsis azurea DSM 43854 TaxID=1238180 RepID=M2PRB7_9PSEU|nr:hypothetical protein [Amycolatopsis azurea]EMD27123.1 hypothetical protein C791_2631 [Amycolatopsis azurea DSM 43854]OOC08669.1 hypothetical protein B0293_01840 [Amycolatopsis azurea DSM 43854]
MATPNDYRAIARRTDRPMWIWAGCALTSVLLMFGVGIFVAITLLNKDDTGAEAKLPEVWPSKPENALRPVPMPTGEMVAALTDETAAQVLCQAIPERRWEEILGDRTLREAGRACHAVTTQLDVSAQMIPALPEDTSRGAPVKTTVAGKLALIAADKDGTRLSVELVEVAPHNGASPVLLVSFRGRTIDTPETESKARALAEALIAGAMPPGPSLPKIGEDGEIAPQQVEAGPLKDKPLPVMSWLLCGELGRALGVPADKAKPTFFASCVLNGVTADYSEYSAVVSPTTTIAGLPAQVDERGVIVQLTDDPDGKTLKFKGTGDLQALAEKMVPPLLGR